MIALCNDTLVYDTLPSHTLSCIFFPAYVTVQAAEGANSLKTTGKLHLGYINSMVIRITVNRRQAAHCFPSDSSSLTECKDNGFFHRLRSP